MASGFYRFTTEAKKIEFWTFLGFGRKLIIGAVKFAKNHIYVASL